MTEVISLARRAPKAETFELGSVVYLNSGSPAMTVRTVTKEAQGAPGKVSVDRFDQATWQSADFFLYQLTRTAKATGDDKE